MSIYRWPDRVGLTVSFWPHCAFAIWHDGVWHMSGWRFVRWKSSLDSDRPSGATVEEQFRHDYELGSADVDRG